MACGLQSTLTSHTERMIDQTKYCTIKENNHRYETDLHQDIHIHSKTGDKKPRIDHDRLYKELFENFFTDFIQLFFPEAYEAIDFGEIKFLNQKIFTDVTKGERKSIDLLVETKLKSEKTAIIIHVETQSYPQSAFNERMFVYFSRLFEKYRCRILPIAVFSHGKSIDEPDQFTLRFPFKQVLDFSFYKLELHKKNWREYIKYDNPVAAALLSEMGYSDEEKVQVKREFLRLLARLQLDPAKMQLIIGFFETYLKLSEKEESELNKEIEALEPNEREAIFRIETSWERKGREAGRIEGKIEGKIEVAKRLLIRGMDVKEIADVTDLSLEEIEHLRSKK